jgi:preprotein translocase SecE subunit
MSIATFFKSTRAEMRHVVWPSRRKALLYTLVVIIFSLALGYMLGGFDSLFRVVFRHVY